MPKFAQLADGRVLEFPDETPDDVMDGAVKRAIQNPYSTKTKEELEAVPAAPSTFKDVSEFGAMSLAGGIKSLTDLFGVDTAASKKMEELQQDAFKRLSPERQRELAIEDELKRRADEEGTWSGIKQAGRSFLRSPLQQTVGAGFSSVPVIAGMALAPEVAAPARIMAGTTLLPKITARMIASSPGIAVGAGMGVGGQKGQDYAAVKQAMLESGASEEEAEAAAIKASEYSLQNAPRQIGSGIAGGAEAALGVESLLGRAGRARTGVKSGPEAPTWGQAVGQSTFGEALPEAVQSGVGAVGTNIALQQAGIDTDLFKGVGGEMTSGALAAAMLGTAVSPLQMRQLRQEFANDQLNKQIEEQKKLFEEYQKRQQTKENLGANILALPAPAPKVEEQDPLFNPLGNFTKEELGPERLAVIETNRKIKGQPLLNSYSIEDIVEAMPGQVPGELADLTKLVTSKAGYKVEDGVVFSPQDVLNAATNKVDTTTQGFKDFLRRTTGSSDLNTMTEPQLYAAFKALDALPVSEQGLTILPEGTNASRYTNAQMDKGLDKVQTALQTNQAVTPEQAIDIVKKATKIKDDRSVTSLLKQLVKENHLDLDADGNYIAPTKIENLPAGYTLEKGVFKQGEKQMYGAVRDGSPIPNVESYDNVQDAQNKVDNMNKNRQRESDKKGKEIQKIEQELADAQERLDAMEVAGEAGTNKYKQENAKYQALVEQKNQELADLQAAKLLYDTPITVGPVNMKQVSRTGFTLFKDGVPVSTHPTADAAMDSLVGTLPDAEVEAIAEDRTPGMRTIARKARQRIERQSRPARKEPEQKAPEIEVTEEDKKNAQVLYKALGRMLKKFGLGDVELQILKGMQDEGSYVANLIKIALDAKDAIGVLRHESIHALKDLGFFSPQQWATLERMAKEKWIDQYLKGVVYDKENNFTRYDAYVKDSKGKRSEAELEELLIEEAIADAFRDFGNKPPPGLMTAILNKIKDFFARLKDAFNMAGIETAEEIFGRIERGGLRASGKVGTGQAKASVRNTAKGFLNPNISAKQEKIINDVIDEMDLTQQEFASTSLIHQTGKAGVDQFESDKIGGLPEVVQFLQDERRKSGLPLLDIDKPEDRKLIAKLMATEAMAAIRSGGANLEWYDSIINKTLAMAGLKYQELNTDINARMAFKIATAITSQGLNVEDNLAFAMRVYDQYRVNKRFPEIGQGEDQNAMIKNFKLANYLMDDMGANLLRQFMETEFTVEEMRSAGFDIKGELGDEMVLGSSVFGPKIGFGFYSNLNGNFEPVTMDMWFMRTIGRLTGKLKSFRQDLYNAQLQKFRDEFDTEGDNGVFANQFDQDEIDIARIDNDAAEELARKVKSAHERDFKANRKAYDDGDREKSKLVAASETMIKSLDSPKDAPSNGTERRNLRDIVRQMVDIVEEKYGKRVPPASLQAVIWYPEQELYKAMGVKLRVTSQNYAGAIEKILKGEGYGESDLSAAAKLGSRTAQQLAKSAVSKGSKKAGTEPVRLGSLEDREKEALLERRRRQLVLEEEKQTPKRMRVIFEVAPDPNNKALTESWRSLPNEDRIRISEKIGNQIIKDALKKFGLTGYVDTQVGSYLDDTNPSFALYLNSGDSVAMAKFLGFVLSQDSMMVVSPKAAKGLEKTGAVRINVGDATPARIDRIYQQLRQIEVDGNKPVGGQSYMNGHMVVLNYSNVSTDQLASLINEKLDDKYEVITEDVYTAFPENKDYDYANPSSDPRGNAGVLRQASRDLRAEATRLLQKELRQFKQESSRRAKEGETPVERKSLRSGSAVNAFNQDEINKESEVGYKKRDKLIDMNIDDFLSLAKKGFVARKQADADRRVAEGTPFTSIPYIDVYPTEERGTTYMVEGHEGRHRARALKKAGYTTMPVVLKTNIRWSEQNDPEKFDYIQNWPEKIVAQEGAENPNFSIDFPVSREESDQSYQPIAKKSLRSQQDQETIADGKERQDLYDDFSPELKQKLDKLIEADRNAEGILVGRWEGKEQQRLKSIAGRALRSYEKAFEEEFPGSDITAANVATFVNREGRFRNYDELVEKKSLRAPDWVPQNIWDLHEKVILADDEASGRVAIPGRGKAPGALKRNQTMAFRRLNDAVDAYVGGDEQAALDLMTRMNQESNRREEEAPVERKSLRSIKDIFERAEEIPMPPGVESIREQWIGGVSGVGDRDAMYDLYRVNGSKKYIQDVQDFLRKELGDNFKGYRLMSNDELEELQTGAMGSQFASFTLSPAVAKAFKNIPAYASKTGLSVVEMDLTPEHVDMIGHPGELELVVDYGQGYNPSDINVIEKFSLRAPDTSEFNNWFSDSKAVNGEGRAQVMYHGTARDISEFKPGVAKAIFISPDPEFAEIFSEDSFNWLANNAKDELSEADQTKTKETAIEQIEKDYEWLDKKDPDYKRLLAHKEGMIKDIQKNAFKKKLGDEAMGYLATAAKNYLPTAPNIMPLFVRAVNPFDYENKKHIDMVVGRVLNFMPESVTTKMEFPEKYLAGLKGLLARGLFTKLEEDAVQKAIRSLGFDSFYVKEMGRKNLAVYSPVQVKSATGNIGTYGLDNPDIRKSIRPPQVPEKLQRIVNETVAVREDKNWLQRLMSAIVPSESDAFRQAAINRYQRIGTNEKRAAKIDNIDQYTADVSAEFAALHSDYAAQLMASAMGVHDGKGGIPRYMNGITMIWNDDGKITGPLDIFQPLAQFGDKAFQHWQFWKSAQRGVRLEKDGKPTQFGQAELQAAKELAALYPKGLFEQVDKAWDRYNRGLVNYMIDTGVINRAMGEEWMKHGDYFPFYRQQMDEDAKGPKMFSAISGVKAPKELKGGDITVGDFFENIIRNTQAAIEAGMKNVAAQKAIDNEVKIGDAKEIVGFKGEPKRPTSMSSVVTVLRNGEVHYYEVKDELFVESLKGLNMGEIPGLWLFSAPANLLRSFVTKTPDFILANMLRDSMSAWVTSGANIKPVIDTARGFGAAMAKTDPDLMVLYNAGLIGGYEFSGRARETGSRLAKKLRKSTGTKTLGEKALTPFTSVWEALESGSTASDAATRLAVYKNVMAETGNQAEAIKRAMEIMNFQRKGNSALIRFVAAAVPFLNARIQGLDVLYRAGIKPFVDRKNASEYEKQVANAFIKRGMLMAAMSVFYYMMVKDDEEYLAQEEEVRDGNWIIPGLGVKIPIPFEVGIIFKTMPERITALLFGNDTGAQFTDSMTRNIQQVFGLQLPQSILPAIEVATGYSFFTHRQITPQGLEDVNKKYQVAPGTSRLAEVVGEFTSFATATGQSYGLSPIQIDHLFKGYTGTLGTYFVDAVDVVINANSDIKSPTKRFEQMPFIRRFALDPDARGNVTAYYDFKNAVDEVVRTSNLLERTGKVENLVEYQMNNMPLLASKDYVNDLYKTMKEFNDMKRMVRMSPMDPDDKRDIILAIQQSENALLGQIKEYKKMIAQ